MKRGKRLRQRIWQLDGSVLVVVLVVLLSVMLLRDWRAQGQSGNAVVVVSAASFTPAVAPDSMASIFGTNLAARFAEATPGQPLSTELAGTVVTIGGQRAPLFYVSPGQLNCLIPASLAPGRHSVSVLSGAGVTSQGEVQIGQAAPGLFTVDASGKGRPIAQVVRVRNNAQITENLGPEPIDLGPENEPVFLVLYLTGVRRAAGNVRVLIGNNDVAAAAAAVGGLAGLDQVNALIPRSLLGRGRVNVAVTVPGLALSNEVQIEIAGSSGTSAPQITGFETAEAVAGEPLVINGNNFNSERNKNTVRIGGLEATVLEASSTRLWVSVPYGAESSPVSVLNARSDSDRSEGRSAAVLRVKTSLSGFVEDTRRQPLRDVTVRLRDTPYQTKTTAEGLFSFKDLPDLGPLVEIEIDPTGTPQLGSLPFPKLVIKRSFRTSRDNYVERIPLQQESGPSVQVGTGASFNSAAAPAQGGFARQIATGGVVLDVPADTPAVFPDGSTSGRITLTVVADSRTPVALPPSEYSSSVVQVTPFTTKLLRGGKLTFPNPERFPAGTQAKLYRLETPPGQPTGFVEVGKAQVSADGQRLETVAGAIDTLSYYFVSLPRRSTAIAGRVLDSDQQTPIRGALVSARGQTTLTDGDGSFVLRSVLVNEGDVLAVEAGFLRPNGRVDRGQVTGVNAVIDGLTTLPAAIVLTSQERSRLPIVLAPDSLILSEGEQKDVLLIAAHPDNGQIVRLEVSGAAFASQRSSGGGLYTLQLRPGANDRGQYTLRLIATDDLGQVAAYEIKLTVNGRPVARQDTLSTTQNQPVSFTLMGEDPEGYALSYAIVANPANGRLSGQPPNLSYTPNPGFLGSDQLIFKVNDALVDSAEARVTFLVNPPANRPPVLTVPGPQTVAVNTPLSFTVTASDPDANQTLTFTSTNRPGGSSFEQTGNNTARFSWTPNATQAGAYTITFEVADNGTPALRDTKTVSLTVNVLANPMPTITGFSPNSVTAGGAAFPLIVNGANFVNASVVRWNGDSRPTTFVSTTQLTAQISVSDIAAAGRASVAVFNPTPGGGLSDSLTFTITPAQAANLTKGVVASGGSESRDDKFILTGTIGQSTTASVTDAVSYKLSSGFWTNDTGALNPSTRAELPKIAYANGEEKAVPGVLVTAATPIINGLASDLHDVRGVVVMGQGFAPGMTLMLRRPDGNAVNLTGDCLQNMTDSSVTALFALDVQGIWTLQIIRPDGRKSTPVTVKVP